MKHHTCHFTILPMYDVFLFPLNDFMNVHCFYFVSRSLFFFSLFSGYVFLVKCGPEEEKLLPGVTANVDPNKLN